MAPKKSIKKSLANLAIAVLLFVALGFFFFRSCTEGYDNYVVYVLVDDTSVFEEPLKPSDVRILDHGRKLKDEIISMDKEIDGADGANLGKLRWYICGGIDCEEGWEGGFGPAK